MEEILVEFRQIVQDKLDTLKKVSHAINTGTEENPTEYYLKAKRRIEDIQIFLLEYIQSPWFHAGFKQQELVNIWSKLRQDSSANQLSFLLSITQTYKLICGKEKWDNVITLIAYAFGCYSNQLPSGYNDKTKVITDTDVGLIEEKVIREYLNANDWLVTLSLINLMEFVS